MAPIELLVNARHLSGPWTGTEVYMARLLEALSRTGQVQISALTWAPLGMNLPGVREVIPARRPGLRPGSLSATLWKHWFDQWYALRAVAPKEGILYHGMDGFLPYSLRSRDRCVTTVHDLGWQAHPELFDRRLRLMYGALFPWVLRRSDRFIAVSRYTADDLMRRAGVPGSKIDVVYHGLDPAFTAAHPSPGGARSEPYVLAVGGVSPRKNTRRSIEAFSRWRGKAGHRSAYRLLITGTSLDRDYAGNGATPPEGVSLLGIRRQGGAARPVCGSRRFPLSRDLRGVWTPHHRGDGMRGPGSDLDYGRLAGNCGWRRRPGGSIRCGEYCCGTRESDNSRGSRSAPLSRAPANSTVRLGRRRKLDPGGLSAAAIGTEVPRAAELNWPWWILTSIARGRFTAPTRLYLVAAYHRTAGGHEPGAIGVRSNMTLQVRTVPGMGGRLELVSHLGFVGPDGARAWHRGSEKWRRGRSR